VIKFVLVKEYKMEKAYIYIKKILFIGICIISGYFLNTYLSLFLILPVLLLAFSLVDSKITGRIPEYLFNFRRTEDYFKKGGLRDLIRVPVILVAFIFNIIVWITWGIYLLFELFIDILFLVKIILFWIFYAIIWFLKLYIPPFIILYKLVIHYLIKWIWWIYQISFRNITLSLNKNYYFIAAKGIILSIFTIFIFYYIGILVEINGLIFIGIILSLLPITWVFGEISFTISKNHQESKNIKELKNYNNGLESVRSILFYITIIILLFIIQVVLNLLGWIPKSGLSLLGATLNINTFISLILIFLTVITIFGVLIIPTFRLFNIFREVSVKDSISFLGVIYRKGLQYVLLLIPSSFFSSLLIIIPTIILLIALKFSLYIKDGVIDAKINDLSNDKIEAETEIEEYKLRKRIDNLSFYKQYPGNIFRETAGRSNIGYKIRNKRDELTDEEAELKLIENETTVQIEQIENQINDELVRNENSLLVEDLRNQKLILERNFEEIRISKETKNQKLIIDIEGLENYKTQLAFALLFAGIWISIFCGLLLAFVFAYLANAFYEIYLFRNDNTPSYWKIIINEEKEKNSNQPLLGFTFLVITIILAYYFLFIIEISNIHQLFNFFNEFSLGNFLT